MDDASFLHQLASLSSSATWTTASRRWSAACCTTPARCPTARSRRSRRCPRSAACRSSGRSCSMRCRPSATRASPSTPRRSASRPRRATTCIIDAPGHSEFLKNMVTGAAGADAAVLVVDADEGVQEQTRRHAYLLRLLGIAQVVVAVNKMDLVGYAEERFAGSAARRRRATCARSASTRRHQLRADRRARRRQPAQRAARMPWYAGPTLLEALDALPAAGGGRPTCRCACRCRTSTGSTSAASSPGASRAARLRVGDTLLFSPINASARVASIESWNARRPREARAPASRSASRWTSRSSSSAATS